MNKSVFLSASILRREQQNNEYPLIDVFAVRDALIALVETLFQYPDYHLVWGGHPSITRLITYVLGASYGKNAEVQSIDKSVAERFHLYQSQYFQEHYPKENAYFCFTETPKATDGNLEKSLTIMRRSMLSREDHEYVAAVFMGGREKGLKEEYELFKENHPSALIVPLASTGGYSSYLLGEEEKASQGNSHREEILKFCQSYRYYELFKLVFQDAVHRSYKS